LDVDDPHFHHAVAFDVVASSLPLGTVANEADLTPDGGRLIWIEALSLGELDALRGPGDSYSDVILCPSWISVQSGSAISHTSLGRVTSVASARKRVLDRDGPPHGDDLHGSRYPSPEYRKRAESGRRSKGRFRRPQPDSCTAANDAPG
jgi:hypothetical protein